MASQIFGMPIAAISLTDRDRQWFKSRVGVDHWSIPRERAPCGEAAETRDFVLIPDLLADDCYANSILAASGVRFYAGAPLVTREGHGLGALCVLDTVPREISDEQIHALRDLAAMVMAQIELQHAFGRIEPASGLPNRIQLLDDLDDLARDRPGSERLAVLIDLARPEQLHQMVRQAASLIRAAAGRTQVYHVASTQFALIPPEGTDEVGLLQLFRERLSATRSEANARLISSMVIGIAPFVPGEVEAADILRSAYGAALDARAQKIPFSVYSAANDEVHSRRFRLLQDFEAVLADPDQLRLVVQPRIDLTSGRCIGAEALIRWQHPMLGAVSPLEFIPLVEHSQLVRALTSWVLDNALAQLGGWRRAGIDLQLSINIFAGNLEEPDFATQVQLRLLKHGVRPEMLELEITESAAIADTGESVAQLATLAEAGVKVAIDDFGTGYSSLAYLQSLPADVVKIDQSFVKNIADDARAAALVRSMIELSRGLGYRVVAEGVESAAVRDLIAGMGCDEAQGFFFARPMEMAEIGKWLSGNRPAASSAAA
jgi:EAL domain-containing protein (putative c-di-GMP-specific phosphodiesterase class I)/GGDEF domain-containing protein